MGTQPARTWVQPARKKAAIRRLSSRLIVGEPGFEPGTSSYWRCFWWRRGRAELPVRPAGARRFTDGVTPRSHGMARGPGIIPSRTDRKAGTPRRYTSGCQRSWYERSRQPMVYPCGEGGVPSAGRRCCHGKSGALEGPHLEQPDVAAAQGRHGLLGQRS